MAAPRFAWTFEISVPAGTGRSGHKDRHWSGDYGHSTAAAETEALAREIVTAKSYRDEMAGDLIGLAVDGKTVWENRTGRPLDPAMRTRAAARAWTEASRKPRTRP